MTFRLLRLIVVLAAYALGLTSLTIYYNNEHADLLLVTVVVMMLAHLMVAIGTINTTLNLASGKRKNTNQNTDSSIRRLWLQAIKRSWPWHAALIIPKMGLSLAFVQYLHTSVISYYGCSYQHPSAPFMRSYAYVSRGPFVPAYPQIETILIALCIIVAFVLAEVSLIAALTQLLSKPDRKPAINISYTVLVRMGLVIIITVAIAISYLPISTNIDCHRLSLISTPWAMREKLAPSSILVASRTIETAYTGSLTIGEQGVLLAANIMRPVGGGTYFAKSNWNDYEPPVSFDNRPFVLRQIVAAALGLGLYAALTWGALRIAQRRYQTIKNPSG